MKISEAKLLISAVSRDQYPDADLPEIAFAGRSNVGKSSLINMLLNRRHLARTSQTPGKTRTINFYEINQAFRLVDLPGYGYARVSKEAKKKWALFLEDYLAHREQLLLLVLLLDVRHEPSEEDKMMISWLRHCQIPHIVLLTKVDKVNQSALMKRKQSIQKQFGLPLQDIMEASSLSKKGKYPFWDRINRCFEEAGFPIRVERQA